MGALVGSSRVQETYPGLFALRGNCDIVTAMTGCQPFDDQSPFNFTGSLVKNTNQPLSRTVQDMRNALVGVAVGVGRTNTDADGFRVQQVDPITAVTGAPADFVNFDDVVEPTSIGYQQQLVNAVMGSNTEYGLTVVECQDLLQDTVGLKAGGQTVAETQQQLATAVGVKGSNVTLSDAQQKVQNTVGSRGSGVYTLVETQNALMDTVGVREEDQNTAIDEWQNIGSINYVQSSIVNTLGTRPSGEATVWKNIDDMENHQAVISETVGVSGGLTLIGCQAQISDTVGPRTTSGSGYDTIYQLSSTNTADTRILRDNSNLEQNAYTALHAAIKTVAAF